MFLLQQGHGMLGRIEQFLDEHPHSGLIISPRICERDQLERYLPGFKRVANAQIFFDPHFYEPRTDLVRVLSYPYFENYNFQTAIFDSRQFCEEVVSYQVDALDLANIILPGRYSNAVTEAWLEMQRAFADVGAAARPAKTVYSTIALGPDAILNVDSWNQVLDEVVNYPVDGVYFVFEHLNNSYFMDEEFLYVILNGLLSLSLAGKKIIVGYANQQSVALAAAGVDWFASGNYRNVRSFDHQNSTDRDTEHFHRAVWYFDGNTFGEYRVPALALAFRRGLRDHFGPETVHSADLLRSERPALWTEPAAFAHYLHLMHAYCEGFRHAPKAERAARAMQFFSERQNATDRLAEAHFSFGDRGFNVAVLATLAALESFNQDRAQDIRQLSD
ncbi:MAG: hypothetical protein NTZ35_08975 [Ignavibacteriales bacterium]|nr:hypothetical protein [Ignavibacteriales bacterium]